MLKTDAPGQPAGEQKYDIASWWLVAGACAVGGWMIGRPDPGTDASFQLPPSQPVLLDPE
eukprot:scaffold18474_cov107-Isochrysis_galbana.AAC.6